MSEIVVANHVAGVVKGEEDRGVEVVNDLGDQGEVVLENVASREVGAEIAVVIKDLGENRAAKLHRGLQVNGVCRELFYQININQRKCLLKMSRKGWRNI